MKHTWLINESTVTKNTVINSVQRLETQLAASRFSLMKRIFF